MDEKTKKESRREAFKILGGLVVSAGSSAGFVHYLVRHQAVAEETVDLGPVAGLPVGEFQKRTAVVTEHGTWFTGPVEKTLWVRRNPDESYLVFTGTCPHMNCEVNLLPEGTFQCPCHDSHFDGEGQVLQPPAPRAMDRLEYSVTPDGNLSVQFRNFRKGVEDKEELRL